MAAKAARMIWNLKLLDYYWYSDTYKLLIKQLILRWNSKFLNGQ